VVPIAFAYTTGGTCVGGVGVSSEWKLVFVTRAFRDQILECGCAYIGFFVLISASGTPSETRPIGPSQTRSRLVSCSTNCNLLPKWARGLRNYADERGNSFDSLSLLVRVAASERRTDPRSVARILARAPGERSV
jgi:hypothetical protein